MTESEHASNEFDEGIATDTSSTADQPRQYIRVYPSEDGLDRTAVESQLRHLHEVLQVPSDDTGAATIECLLVSRGSPVTRVEYYFGIENGDLGTLKRELRGVFPDTYELRIESLSLAEIGDPDGIRATSDESFTRRDEPHIAGVEYHARAERRNDWQVGLDTPDPADGGTKDDGGDDSFAYLPLAGVLETMASTSATVVYQSLLEPKDDWTGQADRRQENLKRGRDTFFDRAIADITSDDGTDHEMTEAEQRRSTAVGERESHRSFETTTRAAVITPSDDTETARRVAEELASAFGSIKSRSYAIEGSVFVDNDRFLSPHLKSTIFSYRAGSRVFEAMRNRSVHPPDTDRTLTLDPWTENRSLGTVADAREVPYFCLLGGETVTAEGNRALDMTPGERTVLPLPPDDRLAIYRTPGFTLGRPVTQDGVVTETPIAVPPSVQTQHILMSGITGAGKSTALVTGALDNHEATDGLDILIDPKDGGTVDKYLLAHFIRHGDLDDVYYFDCAEILPAFSFFDIRPALDAGIPRQTAVDNTIDHYLDIVRQVMKGDNFARAARSPDVIRYLLKALFDPVHGNESFSHRDLYKAARRVSEHRTAPAVSDEKLEDSLERIVADSSDGSENVMSGVFTRIGKITVDDRLARIFGHSPDDRDDAFDLREYLDEDALIIIDTSEVRPQAQRGLTLVVLSELWTALKRRKRESELISEQPLVNLYLDEASTIATSDMLGKLLAEGRGFNCSLTLLTQYPKQFSREGTERNVQEEVLNNIGTLMIGGVPLDERLAKRLATHDMDFRKVGSRLRAINDGRWMLRPRSPHKKNDPELFLGHSASPPPGDPAGDRPATDEELAAYQNARPAAAERAGDISLKIKEPSLAETDEQPADGDAELPRLDSALPYTERLPTCVEYIPEMHALRCAACRSRHSPDIDGMRRAIECCHSLAEIDRDDVPICDLDLKLTPEERAAAAQTDRQLCFLQAVHNAQQQRYDPLEYDIARDSMVRLKEYLGIDNEAVKELTDNDLMHRDTHPHLLYSVTADGRDVIGESHRAGLDHGDGVGDLTESSQHIFAVEVARRYLEAAYVDNDDEAAVETRLYYGVDDGHRLDLVGLDADGEVVVTVEAERSNNDKGSAVPTDFDKMAATGCEDAIWVVMSRSDGHDVLAALNDPKDGNQRVEDTYSRQTPPQQFTIDTAGLTDVFPVEHLRDEFDLKEA
ncbi:type IV secretory system conjugative DNA transfer family protein [Halococcus salifodinae]|uniref:type IV secretory system conjugative DNA transfer family protein n=1 Tax=Halococcus salifodinae TaxID=36738 RepID=UPI003F87A7E8